MTGLYSAANATVLAALLTSQSEPQPQWFISDIEEHLNKIVNLGDARSRLTTHMMSDMLAKKLASHGVGHQHQLELKHHKQSDVNSGSVSGQWEVLEFVEIITLATSPPNWISAEQCFFRGRKLSSRLAI